jgi:FAD/FMN-containing dehydrogenase
MGADNVLSFDAITAEGKYVVANAKENSDLFWALKGGGPSSFAVVVAITVKTFPEVPTAGTILNINSTHTNDPELFRKGFKIFHNLANHYSNHGMFVYVNEYQMHVRHTLTSLGTLSLARALSVSTSLRSSDQT